MKLEKIKFGLTAPMIFDESFPGYAPTVLSAIGGHGPFAQKKRKAGPMPRISLRRKTGQRVGLRRNRWERYD